MRPWWTAKELCDLGLSGLPATESGIIRKAKRESWKSRQRTGRGGGMEYSFSGLPKPIQEQALRAAVAAEPDAELPAPTATEQAIAAEREAHARPVADVAHLKDWQRQCMEARLAIVGHVQKLVLKGARKEQARRAVVEMAAAGELPEPLQRLLRVANARAGKAGKRTVSRRTLVRWEQEAERGHGAVAPQTAEHHAPEWVMPLLKLYCRPHKPSLREIVERELPRMLADDVERPSYWAAQRMLAKLSVLDKNRGRMGPRELKRLRVYRVRDASELWPTDVYVSDGHTFDAEVQHPMHGRPFRPEVTTIIDAHARRIVGWSTGLAENTWGVLDAFRYACETSGIPAIWYTDRGSGFDNAAMSDEGVGLIGRVGSSHERALPYGSQARGVIERSHQTILITAAKRLPTYMGQDMDAETRNKIFKITRKELATVGHSATLPTWEAFLGVVQEEIDYYNDRPQRSLPKWVDEAGKRRNMTPNELWAKAVAEGFEPVMVAPEESSDLFRPYVLRSTSRGLVDLFGNRYFLRDLEHYNTRETGEKVKVGYDIHDPSRVWVRDIQGRLIGIAQLDGNKSGFFPQSVVEQAAERRADARAKRAERTLEEIELERNGGRPVIEHQPVDELTQDLADAEFRRLMDGDGDELQPAPYLDDEDAEEAQVLQFRRAGEPEPVTEPETQPEEPRAEAAERPTFAGDLDRWAWVEEHPDQATDQDRAYIAALLESDPDFRLMVEIEKGRKKKGDTRRA